MVSLTLSELLCLILCKTDPLFKVQTNSNGIQRLKHNGDRLDTEFIADGRTLGEVIVRYHIGNDSWNAASSFNDDSEPVSKTETTIFEKMCKLDECLSIINGFYFSDCCMLWIIRIRNISSNTMHISDIELPLPMNTKYPKFDAKDTFERRVFRHSHISGHGSFVFWLPCGGEGSYLVMTPMNDTKLEFFTETQSNYAHGGDNYHVYIYSLVNGGEEKRGTWRQDHTYIEIAPKEEITYSFRFDWTNSYEGVRDVLYSNGGFDIRVAPGMVIPENLFAIFSLRTKNIINRIIPEFQDKTNIEYLGIKEENVHIYKACFSKLGENKLTVEYDNSKYMILEFFITQPLETLIKKRAAFIVSNQQHRDPNKWYNGLFSLWNTKMPEGFNLLGPDNLGDQLPYAVSGSDDPSNSKCIYLSQKNIAYPDQKEIGALEYFIENFVWGRHQRTDSETPYPYGIYGVDSWLINRFSEYDPLSKQVSRPNSSGSQCRMWRTFDYPTYFALYYNMYIIAKQNPEMVRYLSANGYLERAYGTARAFFEVPYDIRMEGGWSFEGWTDWAYKVGNFHEKYLLPLIKALESEGDIKKADYLLEEWEKKVKYFVYDDPYPFISEMPIDSTAYESSYVIAKYSLMKKLELDENLWQDKNTGKWYSHPKIDPKIHEDFMQRQLLANIACRGWLETSYYHYGSDFRGEGSSGYNMSYMSQIGGWAILDQALHFDDNPAELIRLGYGSLLCSWGLVNSGTEESHYGFWFPGRVHDGFVGWAFMPQKFGSDWNSGTKDIPRGIWHICGEIDHGLTSGIETASTIIVDDPIFGLFAYGGISELKDNEISVICRDGVRQRFYLIKDATRFHIILDRDGFADEIPIVLKNNLHEITLTLENRSNSDHFTNISILGLQTGEYVTSVDSNDYQKFKVFSHEEIILQIPMFVGNGKPNILIERIPN